MIRPTISSQAASHHTWDVVVIGGGPAGSTTALQLASAGLEVLLVDSRAFPRWKVCGACINARTVDSLCQLGLSDRLRHLPGPRIHSFHIRTDRRNVELPLQGGLAVSRTHFDAMLVQTAIDRGAAFLPGTKAQVLDVDGPCAKRRQVKLAPERETPCTTTARLVVAADGLGHTSLAQLDNFRPNVAPSARIGLGASIPVSFGDHCPPGAICMAGNHNGYVGMVRVEDERLNLAAAVQPSLVRQLGPAGAVAQLLRDAGAPVPQGMRQARWQGTAALTRTTRPVADHRLLLVGDAAGYTEPFTGEGIGWAVDGARALRPVALEAVQRWHPSLTVWWNHTYRRQIARRQWACRAIAQIARRPGLTRAVLGIVAHAPGLAAPLINHLHGYASSE